MLIACSIISGWIIPGYLLKNKNLKRRIDMKKKQLSGEESLRLIPHGSARLKIIITRVGCALCGFIQCKFVSPRLS